MCCRPAFRPAYLVALRYHLRRVLDVHRLMNSALAAVAAQPPPRPGTRGTRQLRRWMRGMRPTLDAVRLAVGHILDASVEARAASSRLLGAETVDLRVAKQELVSRSARYTRAAMLANERSLAYTKRFLIDLMHRTATSTAAAVAAVEDESKSQQSSTSTSSGSGGGAGGGGGDAGGAGGAGDAGPARPQPEPAGAAATVDVTPVNVSSVRLLPIHCFSVAVYKYVESLRAVQDSAEKAQLHLSRKPRFAKQLYGLPIRRTTTGVTGAGPTTNSTITTASSASSTARSRLKKRE